MPFKGCLSLHAGTLKLPGTDLKEPLQGTPIPGRTLLLLSVPPPDTHSLIREFEAFLCGHTDSLEYLWFAQPSCPCKQMRDKSPCNLFFRADGVSNTINCFFFFFWSVEGSMQDFFSLSSIIFLPALHNLAKLKFLFWVPFSAPGKAAVGQMLPG